jgi:hypothetical protein
MRSARISAALCCADYGPVKFQPCLSAVRSDPISFPGLSAASSVAHVGPSPSPRAGRPDTAHWRRHRRDRRAAPRLITTSGARRERARRGRGVRCAGARAPGRPTVVEAAVALVVRAVTVPAVVGSLTEQPRRLFPLVVSATTADGATMGPRVEILTMLACDQIKPEYTGGRGMEGLGVRPWGISTPAASSSYPSQSVDLDGPPGETRDQEVVTWVVVDDQTTPFQPSDQCKTDTVVQAAVAKLQGGTCEPIWMNPSTHGIAAMLTLQGVLAVMTVGWWASVCTLRTRGLESPLTLPNPAL